MPPAKPSLVRLSEMAPGQQGDFFALLVEKTRGTTQQGKPYFACRFRDARRTVSFMAWEDGGHYEDAEGWQPGQAFKLRATYNEHEKYGPQVEVDRIRAVNEADREAGFDESEFVERTRRDIEEMQLELRALADEHLDAPLRSLVLALLDRHGQALARLPATRDRAYPFVGGLLEHTLSVAHLALGLAERYASYYADRKPALNKGLVLVAAILHDLGRVAEYAGGPVSPAGSTVEVTVAGRLIGPTLLGRDMVREAARQVEGLDAGLLQLLEHVLLTYGEPAGVKQAALHGTYPARAPALVPEALILHHADRLDQEMEMYVRCLDRDRATGPFTERDPALGHVLFKAGSRE